MKNSGLCFLLCLLPFISQAQHLEVEGNGRIVGKLAIINALGDSSVFIGVGAGVNNQQENESTFVGVGAGKANNIGHSNSFYGFQAGQRNQGGDANSFFGHSCGLANLAGSSNAFYGTSAGIANGSGSKNAMFGVNSGLRNTTGESNCFIGTGAGAYITDGDHNTMIGTGSGSFNSSGEGNVYIGRQSANRIVGSRNVIIGTNAGPQNPSGPGSLISMSNRLYIHNDHSPDPLIYGEFDNRILTINGEVEAEKLSINTAEKRALLTLGGPDDADDGPTMLLYGDATGQIESGRIRFTEGSQSNGWVGAYIHYDGVANLLHIGRHPTIDTNPNQDSAALTVTRSSGNVGVQRTPTTNSLEVNGNASKSSAGGWLANSDRRLKKNIHKLDADTMLNKVLSMRGVTYEWDDQQTGYDRPIGKRLGFIAQDIEKVWPEKVTADDQGYLMTAYGDYDPIFVEAFKAQQAQIEDLQKALHALEEKMMEIGDRQASLTK